MPTSAPTPLTVARGDGIDPEIMEATLAILKAGGARLDIETIEVGEKLYPIELGLEVGMTVSLRNDDSKAGFTLAQGQSVRRGR